MLEATESTSADQRQARRVPVSFLLNKYIRGRPYLCRASDLTVDGMLVHRLFEPENRERDVGLQFQLPGCDRIITCPGRVTFEHDWLPAHGVRFTRLDPEHRLLLERYLRQANTPGARL